MQINKILLYHFSYPQLNIKTRVSINSHDVHRSIENGAGSTTRFSRKFEGKKRNRKLVFLNLRALKSLPTTVLCSRASSLSMNFSPVVWLPTHRVTRFSASRSNSLAAGFTCNKRLSSITVSLICNSILYHR